MSFFVFMYLEKLEINGFKSFASKVKLEFKPGITAIVGPNGSGKSNVADAVRWVLGEQSLKLLRGKKSEDVIFSGSDKKARLGMAEVSLQFNNDQDKNHLDMSEIVITRKLYRSGESEYLINNQKSRLLDIQMLLAKAGVANTSYSIIGQGMIDNFLLASPQERKEFFEEASGVKPLQIKRNQSLNKLEHTEENLETAEIQLQEITPRLNSLSRQVKRLERRTEVELKLRQTEISYFASLWQEIQVNWKNKNQELKQIVNQESSFKDEVVTLQEKLAALTKDSVQSEKLSQLQSNYQKLLEQKMKQNEELSQLKIKAVSIPRPVNGQRPIPPQFNQEIFDKINSLNELRDKMKQAWSAQNYKLIKNFLAEQEQILTELNKILAPYQIKKEIKTVSVNNNHELFKKTEDDIKKIDQEISQISAQIKFEQAQAKQDRSQIWDLQEASQAAQQQLNQATAAASNIRIELARLETRRDDLEQEIRQDLGTVESLQDVPTPKLDETTKRNLITEIGKFKHQLELIGGIDPEVQQEYEEIKTRHEFLSNQIADLRTSINSLEKLILDLDKAIKKQFDSSFRVINEQFQKHFKTLFGGGQAKLILIKATDKDLEIKVEDQTKESEVETLLEDESEVEKIKDRLEANLYVGVEIEATPPGKKLKSINMLSGGERAMTSIALLCAILSTNPSPFIILDEVDAALDEANSLRYADIIENLAHDSQFIIITHNRATMEKAGLLYGVTMGDDGISALLSLKLESAEKYTNR